MLEKIIKAHYCRATGELAPRSHNLVRLAENIGISLQPEQVDLLADMNVFNLEGRYPDLLGAAPSKAEAQEYLDRAIKVYRGLMQEL